MGSLWQSGIVHAETGGGQPGPPGPSGAYAFLQTLTVPGGGATTIDFTTIDQTGTHLYLIGRLKNGLASAALPNAVAHVRFNGDTGSNYDYANHYNGVIPGQASYHAIGNDDNGTDAFYVLDNPGTNNNAQDACDFWLLVPFYAAADAWYKFLHGQSFATDGANRLQRVFGGRWQGTTVPNIAAVSEITFQADTVGGQSFAAGSQVTLYKVT